jgi:hypothetical protein
VELAFYGDLWLDDAMPEDTRPQSLDEADFRAELEFEIAEDILQSQNIPIPPNLESLFGGVQAGFVSGFAILEKLLPEQVNKFLIKLFVRDVSLYLTNTGFRSQVAERVAHTIQQQNQEVAIIAHSLGTVVAYDVLSRMPDVKVSHFVSIGSPLGLKSIRKVITAGLTELFPPNLKSWTNIYNRKDMVSAVRELAGLYPSLDNRSIVDSDIGEGNWADAHSIEVYLQSKVAAKTIKKLLETGIK